MDAKGAAEKGIEKKIWDAACILRGAMDASEYKHVVLGLIFLKHISEWPENGDAGVSPQDTGDEECPSVKPFHVPACARWEYIAEHAHTPKIGGIIDEAMSAVEKSNRSLQGILPKNFARPEVDKRRLSEVVELFTSVSQPESGGNVDVLGRAYEYCLNRFAEQEGRLAGEFYTPPCVVRTLVEVLRPFNGSVYDPCCGSGGMFVQSARFVKSRAAAGNLTIYGQDSNPVTWKLCKMNLAIRRIAADLGKGAADTFFSDAHRRLKADYILANPPFNLSDWGAEKLAKDKRWRYGMPPSGNANFAWMQHMISHMSENGRIGAVLANGSLSSQGGGEGEIRRAIVEDDLVEGIIAMPPQLFHTTQIPVSLWFLNRAKERPGQTLFIDARGMGRMAGRRLREIESGDIAKIAAVFDAFRAGEFEGEPGFSASASIDDIAGHDFVLTPGRYVGLARREDGGESFDEEMLRLTGELAGLFRQGHELEIDIRKRLGALGYEL